MPQFNRKAIISAAVGFGVAAVVVVDLVVMDVAGVGQMVLTSGAGVLAAVLLWVLHGMLFTAVQIAIASKGLDDDDTPSGGKMIPIRVTAPARRKTR